MKRALIIDIIAILFMILFLYTGINKLMEYLVFKEQIAESPILRQMAPIISIALPIFEIVISILLLFPQLRVVGLYAALSMMVLFSLYIIGILIFNDKLPCSCGGVLSQLSWPQHLVFNGSFMMLGIIGIFLQRKDTRRSNDHEMNWTSPNQTTL